MIAMAMSCQPSILIADEPTTALDVTVQATILELMQKLQTEHEMGIMFITHDLGVIAELADKVIVMYKGKIVEQGNVWDIFSNPKHPYTKGLLACRPPLNRRLHWLPTVPDFMSTDKDGEMVESNLTVKEATDKFVYTSEERAEHHKKLYAKEPLLQIKNLKTYFYTDDGVAKAVDNVSFSLDKGETLGLVGESGCGKSVSALSIMRLIPDPPGKIADGEIFFKGKDILKVTEKEMQSIRGNDIGMIFQEPMTSLNPVFTCGDQIEEAVILHQKLSKEEAKKKAIEMLKLVGIPAPEQRYNEYPHQLSGGMRQRIMIAMALSCNPELLIADEPTTALDVTVQAQILELINKLQKELGMGVIMITHDLGVIAEVSTKVVVMYASKVAEYGLVDQIFYNPKHPYTIGLLNSIPKLSKTKARLATIEGNVPPPTAYPKGCHFCTRCTFVIDKCWTEPPPAVEVEPGHISACWRVDEIDKLKESYLQPAV